jgi:DegV family protein with EDD domain
MIKKVAITTDSTCGSPELARRFDIGIIPYPVIMNGKSCSDLQAEALRQEIYDKLRKREELPFSGVPSPGEFLQVWQDVSRNTEAVVHFTITPSFTGAYSLALEVKQTASEQMPQKAIDIIDTKTVSCGQFLIVLEAAKAALEGKNLESVINIANDAISRLTLVEIRDTLFYLDNLGRTHDSPEAHSWAEAESVTSFKSLIETDASTGGKPKPLARAKTRTQIIKKMLEIAEEKVGAKEVSAAITHVGAPEDAEQLKETILSHFDCNEIYVYEGSVVTAIYNGLGFLELALLPAIG